MATKPPSAQAAALAVELRVLIGQLNRRLREQATAGDLTNSQKTVMLQLERDGPATVSTLARTLNMRPQSMGATVAALQQAGLVAGAPDPADGRQTILSLTAACREWLKISRAAREDWLARAVQAQLAPQEQKELAASLALLKRLADA